MPALKILELSFHFESASGIAAWNLLANVPRLPNLEELALRGCSMSVHALTKFTMKHTDTLKILDIIDLKLHEGTLTDMSLFYLQLSITSRVNDYRQQMLALVTDTGTRWSLRYIGLPRHLCLPYIKDVGNDDENDDENEDGFIEVGVLNNVIRWKGRQEVKDMLSDLSVCLF